MTWMNILFLFLDGIGIGRDDPGLNPFAELDLPSFEKLAGGHRWIEGTPETREPDRLFTAIDANLGMEGLPQSGTGQATLFTGVNCARIADRHYGPFPHSKTKPTIEGLNVFRRLEELFPDESEPCAFANAYPERFFGYVEKRDRWTVTTRSCLYSNTRIRSTDDLRNGLAVPADLTGKRWPEPDEVDMMPADERAAARRLLRIASHHHFTLFEYFFTDKAGHKQSSDQARRVLTNLDILLDEILTGMQMDEVLLLLTSDHGNLEDLSTKSHTRNPVPFVAYGRGADEFGAVKSLVDVTPAIVALFGGGEG
jgi:hypothetical protein